MRQRRRIASCVFSGSGDADESEPAICAGIPGINTGRGIGLIETRGLTRVVDAIGLLGGCESLDHGGSEEAWKIGSVSFLQWMLESKNGRDEAAAKTITALFTTCRLFRLRCFLDKTDLAATSYLEARNKTHRRSDRTRWTSTVGTRAYEGVELQRRKSRRLMLLARLGENVGVDLWNYQTRDGRSIRKALDFLVPFAVWVRSGPTNN